MPERRIEDEDGLFSCCADGGTSCITTCCCTSFVPAIIAAFRMGWKGVGLGVGALFAICIICYASMMNEIIRATNDAMADSSSSSQSNQSYNSPPVVQYDLNPAAVWTVRLAAIALMIILAYMRISIIKRHGRTDTEDYATICLRAWCCAPCLAAQMMRWTDGRYENYDTVDIEMPADGAMMTKEVI